ncbi:MAG: lysine--tRNA ligase [Bacilli bacterium]|nr:lysine--tRNA ligase [Bacilli bacterium]
MNWALEEAKKLVEKHPEKEEFVIASGVSPSGFIHIGNFREIVTTFFVGKELENLGKKVRFILSFDDFDRFRKVPKGMPESYSKYIGMPYTSIPSPFSENKTYAKEMEDIFVSELNRLGINPETISQTEQYKSGRYDDKIKLAMEQRKKIFDIMANYKTQEFTEEDRNNYYPISLYCEECGKDSTTILNYNDVTGDVEYKCTCGHHHIQNINKCGNIKLQWKIDWPMRWQKEGVIFEPGGRDHSAENGSYAVSKEISKRIFEYEAPSYVAYDFIGIKGANGKMASSTGNVLTLTDLLSVYDKNIILWFYAKNRPNHQFNIALDEDVLRFYTEYDRMVKAYFEGKLDDKNSSIISLTGVTSGYVNNPNFGYIANFLPMVSYKEEALAKLLSKENIDCSTLYFKNRLLRATNWLEKYNNSKIKVLDEFNQEYYETLSDEEKEWLEKTLVVLQNEYETTQDLQTDLYAIVKNGIEDSKELKNKQRRYFQIIYNLIIGKDNGPKMGLLLSAMDYEVVKSKLQKSKEKKLR